MTISAKFISIPTTGFRGDDFLKFSHRYIMETGHASLAAMFLTNRFCLIDFCRSSSSKLFSIMTTDFTGEDFQNFQTFSKSLLSR